MSELQVASNGAVSTQVVDWSKQHVDASNILIPKLLLMQGLSDLVSDGKAKLGDIVKSTSGEVVGGVGKPVEVIPIMLTENWALLEKVGNKFEYRGIEPVTLANKDAEYEYTYNGTQWRRDRCLDFYVLLPSDIAKEKAAKAAVASGDYPDPDAALLPCAISFRRTSMRAGKDLATHFAKASHFGMPPAVTTFKLTSFIDKNNQGTYAVFQIEKGGKTAKEDLDVCHKWYQTISASRPKVHDVEVVATVEEPKAEAAPAAKRKF
jgi:hypothetical protein